MLNRRYFLAVATGTLVSIGLPAAAAAIPSPTHGIVSGVDPNLKAKCDVICEGQIIARLNLVALSSADTRDSRLYQSILNFESDQPVNLPEASYEIEHPVLGRLNLFLQPCGTLDINQHDGKQYRACISTFR